MENALDQEDYVDAAHENETENEPVNAERRMNTTRVIHYRVELPPCFHGDGKDKESFSLWKTRLELAVKACTDTQHQDLATILPTRLSGDALSYWVSLSPEIQQDYAKTVEKLKEVFGRKEYMLYFQTFVNARPRQPKEALEVYAAEIGRLVQEAFPNYGQPAVKMERFRRFVAGLDPVLQAKCHEHGASSLEEALTIACKWERAQEALKTVPPYSLSTTNEKVLEQVSECKSGKITTAMVSSKSVASASEESPKLMQAIVDLTADVKALRVEINQLKQQKENLKRGHNQGNESKRDCQHSPERAKQDRGREKYRSSRQVSPEGYSSASRLQKYPSSPSHVEHSYRNMSPGARPRYYSPPRQQYERRSPSPSHRYYPRNQSPSNRYHSSYHDQHYSPRYSRSPSASYSHSGERYTRRTPSPKRNEGRPGSRYREQHLCFDPENTTYQGNEW